MRMNEYQREVILELLSEIKNRSPFYAEKFRDIDPERFDVMHGDGLYEGTLWQYRWAVPFDLEALCGEAGGKEKLLGQLEYFFEHELYNQGNQPDIHAPYIFGRLGLPDLTRRWVNKLLTKPLNHWYGTHRKWEKPYHGKAFRPVPEAYIPEMDDDDGTMAAWYVFSALGMYPLTPPVSQVTNCCRRCSLPWSSICPEASVLQ